MMVVTKPFHLGNVRSLTAIFATKCAWPVVVVEHDGCSLTKAAVAGAVAKPTAVTQALVESVTANGELVARLVPLALNQTTTTLHDWATVLARKAPLNP